MWLCNNNSELATLPWEKTGLGKIYKDIHSVVVSSWLNVHQFPIHDQPVRRAVIIATWIHDSISCVFHNDNQNISPFQIVFRLKMNELRNFNLYKRILTLCATGHPARCLCPLVERHQFHQQAASWLLFKNVKWPVVHDVFATFQPLNKRRHMVNHDLLIRLSLIYRYILDYTRGFSFSSTSMTDFWRCELLWYRLPSSAMVDADALVPHRSQSTSTSRFGNLIFR